MFLTSGIAAATGALALFASPGAASAAPISITSCDVSSTPVQVFPETARFWSSNVRLTFVNQAPVPATDVRIAVSYRGQTQVLDDAGTFSTGTPITQDLSPSPEPQYDGAAACSVQAVTFSDGSTWHA
jgi:hypothetical protein